MIIRVATDDANTAVEALDATTHMLQMVKTVPLFAFLLAAYGCGEKGHVRVRDAELPGSYITEFQSGKEQLTLRSDKTYEQIFSSPKRHFTNQGKWESHYVLLEGTDVLLLGANCSEDSPQLNSNNCQRNLNVHREGGKLRLALNETADWYFDRVD